jgi:hypothetical protein
MTAVVAVCEDRYQQDHERIEKRFDGNEIGFHSVGSHGDFPDFLLKNIEWQ